MKEIKELYLKRKIDKTIESLKKNNFEVILTETLKEARKELFNFIP